MHSIVTQHNCNTNVNMNDCDEIEPYFEENVCGDGYEGIPDYPSSHTLKIKCGKTDINTVLDNASDRTVCTMECYKKLPTHKILYNGTETHKKVKVRTMGGLSSVSVFKIVIALNTKSNEIIKLKVHVLNSVTMPRHLKPESFNVQSAWPTLDKQIVKEIEQNQISKAELIIGMDNYYKIVTGKMIIHSDENYAAIHTKYGWSIGAT